MQAQRVAAGDPSPGGAADEPHVPCPPSPPSPVGQQQQAQPTQPGLPASQPHQMQQVAWPDGQLNARQQLHVDSDSAAPGAAQLTQASPTAGSWMWLLVPQQAELPEQPERLAYVSPWSSTQQTSPAQLAVPAPLPHGSGASSWQAGFMLPTSPSKAVDCAAAYAVAHKNSAFFAFASCAVLSTGATCLADSSDATPTS